jgi:O-antigen ligase
MKVNNIFSWIFLLSACAILAIGRIYDERLDFFDIRFSLILSIIYIASSFVLITSIKNIKLGKCKNTLVVFYSFIFIITPILWVLFEYMEYGFHNTTYEYMEYGILKYLNFVLIVIPISIIISEKFNYNDVSCLFKIFLLLTLTLSVLGVAELFSDIEGRLSVLGGGPIVFARWMNFAILILIFYPQTKWKKIRYLLVILFLLLSFAAGSRGPVFAIIISLMVYFFLNFRKTFFKLIIFSVLFIFGIMFTSIGEKVIKLGGVDRIVMNISQGGSVQSTGARIDFLDRSLVLLLEKPYGVGCGNWQVQANKNNSKYLMAHAYPHNLIFELINEYGILAGLIFLLLMWQTFYLSYQKMIAYKNNKSSFYALLFYSLIFFFINSMVSGDLGDARMLFIIIAMIVISNPLIIQSDER